MHSEPKNSGRWLVIGMVALGVALALIGLKYRRFPEGGKPGMQQPATTQTTMPRNQ
jgi:hypothetical protein